MRESMGISAETTTRAFKETGVVEFIERPRLKIPRIDTVFISVDPSGGGSSAFAIASIGRSFNGDTVVRAPYPPPHTLPHSHSPLPL